MAEGMTKAPKKEPTASEAMFFFAIVKHTRNKADIDWDLVAAEQGFKNAEVAKVRFGQVKRKLGITTSNDTPGSSPRSVAKKGTIPADHTPAKVRKNSARTGTKGFAGRGRARVKKEEPAEDVDDATVGDADTVKAEPVDPAAQFEADMNAIHEDDPF
ncbi:Uncharacterized protein TCAP_01247 [Tolypocladium capitatum]|uniref:Myb-like DNA-binding domain-containing protein n=1 Tax=Tolypocladium capitatum TaxID=45235 RepID=A0A2K3QMS9_9HYPO|nr:Uncharacterized protein TCAP_01247 [Tolypocladium capitatum]